MNQIIRLLPISLERGGAKSYPPLLLKCVTTRRFLLHVFFFFYGQQSPANEAATDVNSIKLVKRLKWLIGRRIFRLTQSMKRNVKGAGRVVNCRETVVKRSLMDWLIGCVGWFDAGQWLPMTPDRKMITEKCHHRSIS